MEDGEQTLINEVPGDVLSAAVVSNDSSVVLSWLENLPEVDEIIWVRLVQILQQSAYYLSVDVVSLFQPPTLTQELLSGIINFADSNEMCAIHCALEGYSLQQKELKVQYSLLNILAHLCEQGGSLTITCYGRTPKMIAEEKGCKIAAALLEIYENARLQQRRCIPTPEYEEINVIHKSLLHWAVYTDRDEIASQILVMHQRDTYDSIAYLLFENDPNSLKSLQEAPIYIAAKMTKPKMLEVLTSQSGIPLNVVFRQRKKLVVPRPDDTTWEAFITPLSLILSKPHYSSFIDMFVTLDESHSDNCLTSIDLSETKSRFLPVELFKFPHLQNLNVNTNKLKGSLFLSLPDNCWPHALQDLNISRNHLESIPAELFNFPCLKTLNVSRNPLKSLPNKWWTTKSIETFNASYTQLSRILVSIDDQLASQHIGSSASLPNSMVLSRASIGSDNPIAYKIKQTDSILRSLNVSNSNIDKFPSFLAVVFPNLEILNLSGNIMQSCCAINELPVSLEELDISGNLLQCSNRQKLFNQDARLATKSSCMLHRDLNKLRILNLSNNFDLRNVNIHVENEKGQHHILFPRLKKLYIADCGLQWAPSYLSELHDLTDLDVSNNKDLPIPREICNLEHLVSFNYEGVQDPIVNQLSIFTMIRDMQIYLRERNAVRSPTIKLVFAGDKEIDLPLWLSDPSLRDKGLSLVVTDEYTWSMSKPKSDLVINFNVWNFIGQDEHNSVVQCFLTERALYVLCWLVTTSQDHGISKLWNWLLRIKDRVTDASVILVGCLSKPVNDHVKHEVISQINNAYGSQQHYPSIIGVYLVSTSKQQHDIKQLRAHIYDAACGFNASLGSKKFSQKLKDMKIPMTYCKLQELISLQVMRIKTGQEDGPPLKTWTKVVQMVNQQYPQGGLFVDERELTVAVKYMKQNGTIMHFDLLGLSDYYFIDPHWLYDLFCQVCTSPLLASNKVDNSLGKVKLSLIHQIFDEYKIPTTYYHPLRKLLCRFEIAIPLDSDTLLLPSFFQCIPENIIFDGVDCNFPRNQTPVLTLQKNVSYDSLLPALAHVKSVFETIYLHFTGMCYRRLFLVHHIPENFWQRLISRFLVSAGRFYEIFLSNCVEGTSFEKMTNIGDAVICKNHCKWLYWGNGITLTFGNDVLLCVNGLMQSTNSIDKIPLTSTVSKIKPMKFLTGSEWVQGFTEDTDGFEVNIPDYTVQSSTEGSGNSHYSCILSSQILSYVLDIVSESCTEFFKSLTDGGIYSNFFQLVVCPYCYGDKCVNNDVTVADTLESSTTSTNTLHSFFTQPIQPIDIDNTLSNSEGGCHGFTIQVCILNAQKGGTVSCPSHGRLDLIYLTPDLMFEDVTLRKVRATEVGQPLGKGSFGSIYKVKLSSNPYKEVALKCFINLMVNGKHKELSLQDFAVAYSDIRMELNKLSSTYHPNIVKFLGLCVISFSFLLEWAPKGNLYSIVEDYKLVDLWICPDAVANTIHQVSSALAYLHTTKNIVHFDINPANILVFKYPQAGHNCFSKETSLNCGSCYSEGGGVLVKLADLGISALVGPSGFQRKSATPTYAAPEVIKYSGKEPLTEKVDVYSFGVSLYEIMTLRKLPPEGASLDFSADIIAGRRPDFLPEDANYPLPLVECVKSCWAQSYTQRPSAERIRDYFEPPNCLWLKDCYELPNMFISTVLIQSEKGTSKEIIWISSDTQGEHSLESYMFSKQEDDILDRIIVNKQKKKATNVHMKLFASGHSVKLRNQVKEMCHHNQLIWIIYCDGTLAICDVNSRTIVKEVVLAELCANPVTILVADRSTGLIAIAYRNGIIPFLWANDVSLTNDIPITYFYSFDIVNVAWNSFNLNTMDACVNPSCGTLLWCSFDTGKIQIVKPPVSTSGETEIVKVLEIKEYCTDLPHDTSIVQLKCSPNQDHKLSVMYALHDGGLAISCWSVDVDPKLYTIIKPSLSSPVTVQTLLPISQAIFIGDSSGRVHKIDVHHIMEGKYSSETLHGSHNFKVDFLVSLHRTVNAHGFLSETDVNKDSGESKRNSLYYVRGLESVPCTVLMSVGVGYQELFTSNTNKDTCFITWAMPYV